MLLRPTIKLKRIGDFSCDDAVGVLNKRHAGGGYDNAFFHDERDNLP